MVKTTGVPSGRISPSSEISRQNAVRAPRTKVLAARAGLESLLPVPVCRAGLSTRLPSPESFGCQTRQQGLRLVHAIRSSQRWVSEDMPSKNHTPHPPFPQPLPGGMGCTARPKTTRISEAGKKQ
ncbi:hypothetical protein BN1723_006626 [Verticillium longisporum]|uniref:Uncharacterized protein n=1 Tax=Verticillium longisporum TaxID=100787 RepID=A0A0G4NGI3_VERLO|nr:hypothetical protein BN1723_006626 [Verticillium longisporum]